MYWCRLVYIGELVVYIVVYWCIYKHSGAYWCCILVHIDAYWRILEQIGVLV